MIVATPYTGWEYFSFRGESKLMNPFGIKEITVKDLDEKRQAGGEFVILDVREKMELMMARMRGDDIVEVPMSELARQQLNALPAELHDTAREIYVLCHHGNRSAQVTAWLAQNGYANVVNVRGGIAAWARQVDRSVGTY